MTEVKNKTTNIYTEWRPLIDALSNEDAGKLLKDILKYQSNEDVDNNNPVWIFIKSKIDEYNNKGKQISEKRKEIGKKGGLAKASKCYQKLANDSKSSNKIKENKIKENKIYTIQDDLQLDNQDENQVGIKLESSPFMSNKNISNKKSIDEILDGMDENYKPIVEDWLKYKKERGESYKPIGLKKMIENLVKMSENNPVLARAIVDRSITNNWSGLFELKPDEKEKALKFENNKKQDLILDLETLANAKDEERKNWSSEQWDIYYKVVFGIESMDRRNGNV